MSEVESNSTFLASVCASTNKAPSLKEQNPASDNDIGSTVKWVIASYEAAPRAVKEAIDAYNAALLVVKDLVSKHDVDLLMIRETLMIPSANKTTNTAGIGALETIVRCEVIDAYHKATLASTHLVCTYQDAFLAAIGVNKAMNNSTNNAPQVVKYIAYHDALLVAKNLVGEYNDGLLVVGKALAASVNEARSLGEEAPIQTSVVAGKIVDALTAVMDAYNNALARTKDLMLAYKDAFLLITGASANEEQTSVGHKRIREEASLGEQKKLRAAHTNCAEIAPMRKSLTTPTNLVD